MPILPAKLLLEASPKEAPWDMLQGEGNEETSAFKNAASGPAKS